MCFMTEHTFKAFTFEVRRLNASAAKNKMKLKKLKYSDSLGVKRRFCC